MSRSANSAPIRYQRFLRSFAAAAATRSNRGGATTGTVGRRAESSRTLDDLLRGRPTLIGNLIRHSRSNARKTYRSFNTAAFIMTARVPARSPLSGTAAAWLLFGRNYVAYVSVT